MTPRLIIDDREFQQALRQYAAVSSRNHAEIVNKQMVKLGFAAMRNAPKANKSEINALKDEYKLWSWVANKVFAPGEGTFAQRKKVARKWLGRRKRAVSFMKSFFVTWLKQFRDMTQRQFAGVQGIGRKASDNRPETTVTVRYDYKSNTIQPAERHKQGAESLLLRALNAGIKEVAEDMMVYVRRKQAELAAKYSARGARSAA
jgi:hypothetical protein